MIRRSGMEREWRRDASLLGLVVAGRGSRIVPEKDDKGVNLNKDAISYLIL